MLDHTDAELRRFADALAALGRLEQTGDCTASVHLLVDAKEVASGKLDAVLPNFHGWEGLDVGQDGASPVSSEYDGTFPYQGHLDRVVVRPRERRRPTLRNRRPGRSLI